MDTATDHPGLDYPVFTHSGPIVADQESRISGDFYVRGTATLAELGRLVSITWVHSQAVTNVRLGLVCRHQCVTLGRLI